MILEGPHEKPYLADGIGADVDLFKVQTGILGQERLKKSPGYAEAIKDS
ncbi:hypothetical protein LQZ21_00225 [Treponema sp. TIM-1]